MATTYDEFGNEVDNDTSTPPPVSSTTPSEETAQSNGDTTEKSVTPTPSSNKDVAESKTPDKESSGQTTTSPNKGDSMFSGGPDFLPSTEKNILHNYRSWVYNFAIGAITPEAVSNQKFLERDIKLYPVLNSAGKGSAGMATSNQGLNADSRVFEQSKKLIEGFNANSPGRFDMFIDNVVVDSTIGAGTKQGGTSIATNITFDIFEPYSMNGFIEAMQVAAKAAGYSDYMKSAFVLRVQFQGYSDKAVNAQMTPEIVPMSTRYFPITITEIGVDVTESGTRYKVNSVPVPQMGLGEPNRLTSDVKVEGKTVGEILLNFFNALNKVTEDKTKKQTDQAGRDRYEIACPKLVTVGDPQQTKKSILNGTTSTGFTSDIIKAKMNDELTSVNVFKMASPSAEGGYAGAKSDAPTTAPSPSTNKLPSPKDGVVAFASGAQIHDCIAAIVRDSEYTRDLLKPENLDKVKADNGLITYFTVRMEMDIHGDDKVGNKKFKTYRYVLEPFQMHFTRIPGQEQGTVDLKEIKKSIKREYNYIYTGKNEDVLKFNLKFDNLYFSAIPASLGNRDDDPKANAAGPNNEIVTKLSNSSVKPITDSNSNPQASVSSDHNANTFKPEAKAGQLQGDPYALMAFTLHDAVLNKVDLISGTLEILGDPYYLVTGGMGNSDLNLKEPMLTVDGQAPTTQGELYVNINFRNPIDINSKTGMLDFGSSPISFSGVYMITQLKNTFKDGLFQQALEILRVPGQILGKEKEKPAGSGKTSPRAGQQLIKDTAPANILKNGIRPSDFNLANLLDRGLPSIGLPGNVSNFTNSLIGAAGLTGVTSAVGGLLNQVSGASGVVGNLTGQLGVSPVGGLNALTSGVRLAASGLASLSAIPNTGAANITAAGNSIGNIANIPNAATSLASNAASSISSLPTAAIAAASGVASNLTGQASALVQNVSGLATKGVSAVSGLMGDAKNAIAGLQNTMPTDFASVGSKLGIDTSALAGLSPDQASKMATQLAEVAKSVPENTDLGSLKEQGVTFANLTKTQIANLPAFQPKSTAPFAITNPGLSTIADGFGSVNALLDGKANLAPLTDINKITNPLGSVTAGLSGGFGLAQSASGAVANANSLINSTIGSAVGIANNVGSLAQNSIQGFAPASIGLGSIESNINTVANLTQNITRSGNNLGMTVASQYGSLQSSPLAKLVKDSNIQGSV
jgi:hypothetical protein